MAKFLFEMMDEECPENGCTSVEFEAETHIQVAARFNNWLRGCGFIFKEDYQIPGEGAPCNYDPDGYVPNLDGHAALSATQDWCGRKDTNGLVFLCEEELRRRGECDCEQASTVFE